MTKTYKDLVKYNKPEYNYSKLAEELSELLEITMKKLNKKGTPKEPPIESFIDKIGDVLLRIQVVIEQENIRIPVLQRIQEKSSKLAEYMKQHKYKGTL